LSVQRRTIPELSLNICLVSILSALHKKWEYQKRWWELQRNYWNHCCALFTAVWYSCQTISVTGIISHFTVMNWYWIDISLRWRFVLSHWTIKDTNKQHGSTENPHLQYTNFHCIMLSVDYLFCVLCTNNSERYARIKTVWRFPAGFCKLWTVFSERVISHSLWPPHSSDIIPCVFFFFLWEYLKYKVCWTNPYAEWFRENIQPDCPKDYYSIWTRNLFRSCEECI